MKIKKTMISWMDRVILDCKQTTFYTVKEIDHGKIPWLKKLKYKTHLSYCSHCKKFYKQTKKIDAVLKITPEELEKNNRYQLKLNTKTKENIVKQIKKNQNYYNL